MSTYSDCITQLNDTFRKTFSGGKVTLTQGIAALRMELQQKILAQVQEFNDFNSDNDPYAEHDFGAFKLEGKRICWKIDYYDLTLTYGSEHPEDPTQTVRVLTVMLANEY